MTTAIWNYIMAQLKDVTLLSTFVRLLLAAVFGGLIGVDRGRRRRAAGLRTHMLVCIGSALVMITNQYIYSEFGASDPTRLGAQVISGIGFLGVGTIIVDRQQHIKGLTTAAGLWACACMGLAIGVGFYSGAIISCLFIIATITILNKLELRIIDKTRVLEVYAEFENHGEVGRFLRISSENGIKVMHVEMVPPRGSTGKDDLRAATVATLRMPRKQLRAEVLEGLSNMAGLITIEELK